METSCRSACPVPPKHFFASSYHDSSPSRTSRRSAYISSPSLGLLRFLRAARYTLSIALYTLSLTKTTLRVGYTPPNGTYTEETAYRMLPAVCILPTVFIPSFTLFDDPALGTS
jgi:hypothetical protein